MIYCKTLALTVMKADKSQDLQGESSAGDSGELIVSFQSKGGQAPDTGRVSIVSI